ncbi:MAG: hypothetical protein JWP34_4531 [Massilia sp.]|nr:hypothetical protein [Gemmatimonadales bacterium]MDB5910417.1 hypothetical protein [Massilia sp.]
MRTRQSDPGDELASGSRLDDSQDLLADLPGCPPESLPLQDQLPPGSQLGDVDVDGDGVPRTETSGSGKPVRPQLDASARKAFAATAAGVVEALGGLLNAKFSDPEDPTDDVWIPTDQESDQIGQPLGRILARHTPLPGGEEHATDVADGIAIAIGAVMYGLRNLGKLGKRARRKRGQASPQVIPDLEQAA